MTDVVIAGAARTPVGSFNGSLSSLAASKLGALAIKEALKRAKVEAAEVDEAILGQIHTARQGQNPAPHTAVVAGIPYEPHSYQIHQLLRPTSRAVANCSHLVRVTTEELRVWVDGCQYCELM